MERIAAGVKVETQREAEGAMVGEEREEELARKWGKEGGTTTRVEKVKEEKMIKAQWAQEEVVEEEKAEQEYEVEEEKQEEREGREEPETEKAMADAQMATLKDRGDPRLSRLGSTKTKTCVPSGPPEEVPKTAKTEIASRRQREDASR